MDWIHDIVKIIVNLCQYYASVHGYVSIIEWKLDNLLPAWPAYFGIMNGLLECPIIYLRINARRPFIIIKEKT
jgi:hypothetical protein